MGLTRKEYDEMTKGQKAIIEEICKMTNDDNLRLLLVEQLAKDLGTTKQNLYQQFKRDNFKENDMKKICDVLGYEISINIEKI